MRVHCRISIVPLLFIQGIFGICKKCERTPRINSPLTEISLVYKINFSIDSRFIWQVEPIDFISQKHIGIQAARIGYLQFHIMQIVAG